jgi:CheY-like chemotaxis protein
MPSGGTIKISAHCSQIGLGHPTHLSPGLYTCLMVSDTGQGMDEATLARVTEPFFTTKGVGKGTGLGLAMVDGLMDQSGGKLLIRSRPHCGTTVELWLPAAGREAITGTLKYPDESVPTPMNAKQLVVLVVDDDSLVLLSTSAMLEDLGHQVISATSASKALEILSTSDLDIDLLISDQVMPGMTGLELARTIRASRPRLPIILASGYAELPPGLPDISRLAKPFTQRDLVDAMAAVSQSGFPDR